MKVLNGVPLSLDVLRAAFPKKELFASARTGWIPIEFFVKNEEAIREVCKQYAMKAVYRGPRKNAMRTFTARADAVAVVLYDK